MMHKVQDPELQALVSEFESGSESDGSFVAARPWGRRAAAAAFAVAAVGLVAFAGGRLGGAQEGVLQVPAPSEHAQIQLADSVVASAASAAVASTTLAAPHTDSAAASAHAVGAAQGAMAQGAGAAQQVAGAAAGAAGGWASNVGMVGTMKDGTPATNSRYHPGNEQARNQNLNDGNPCGDEEEVLGGLCYTKCDILTGGDFKFRNSAFSCCKTNPCGANIFNMKVASVVPCHGFDVSSEDDGRDCPHSVGLCLDDEEQFLDMCYKTCASLTKGEAPFRVAAATCCKEEGLACFNPLEDKTNAKFDVGGGTGADASPHLPVPGQAER